MFGPDLLRVDELADRLGVTRRTINRRIKSGALRVTNIGGTRFVSEAIREDGDGTPGTQSDEKTRDTGRVSGHPGRNEDSALTLIVSLQSERAELVRQVVDAERRLATVGAELAEHRTLASVAVGQIEAEREIRDRAERDLAVEVAERAALAAELEAMRHKAAATLEAMTRRAAAERERAIRLADAARLPWYSGRKRRAVLRAMGAEG